MNNSDIPDWHIWDLKKATAEFLVPRLEMFRNWVESGKMKGMPTWVAEEFEIDLEDVQALEKTWMFIISEMIYAFKVFAGDISVADEDRLNRGFDYFSKYYMHLWD